MTNAQMNKEMLYHASLSPFKSMLASGLISEDDYRVIDTILRGKYSPIFVDEVIKNHLIIKEKDGNMSLPKGGLGHGKTDN